MYPKTQALFGLKCEIFMFFFKMAAKTITYFTIINSINSVISFLMLKSAFLALGYIRRMCRGKNTMLPKTTQSGNSSNSVNYFFVKCIQDFRNFA